MGMYMENYYDELIKEIQDLITSAKSEEAMFLIKKEFSMPYIPQDVEEKLKELRKTVRYSLADKSKTTEETLDALLDDLQGNPQQQLAACSKITNHNLRDCIEEIQNYLKGEPYPEAAALLVEAIAEQEIQEEFVWNKQDIEYTFYGDSVTPCAKSKGFLCALSYLQKWFAKNLDMYEMSKTLLIHEVFMFLPLSYEESEGKALAFDVFEQICQMMGREDMIKKVSKEVGILNVKS